uniref:Uncharacterized protein n=1 Tax=Pseudonaja textilis TaxID=8673 RepID=A0A670YNJ1_PSETE
MAGEENLPWCGLLMLVEKSVPHSRAAVVIRLALCSSSSPWQPGVPRWWSSYYALWQVV